MVKVVKSDPVSPRGERRAQLGDTTILNGFEFNSATPLTTVFMPHFTSAIDRPTGTGSIQIPAYVPQKMIAIPEGATHYCLLAGIAATDFATEQSWQSAVSSQPRPLDNIEVAASILSVALTESAKTHPAFLVFGIEFFQMVNGNRYELNNTGHNALAVVAVNVDT